MYNHDKIKHTFTLQPSNSKTGIPTKQLAIVPAIILDPGDFSYQERFPNADRRSMNQEADNLIRTMKTHIHCGSFSDMPSSHILINCMFHSEVSSLPRALEEYCDDWKLIYIQSTSNLTIFRLANIPASKKDCRIIAEIKLSHAALNYSARIQYPASKDYECELYKVAINPNNTPDCRAALEVGIRDLTNYPADQKHKNKFDIAKTIRDYMF